MNFSYENFVWSQYNAVFGIVKPANRKNQNFSAPHVWRHWNWGDGLPGIRELFLRRIRRIRSFAGIHIEPRKTRIFILFFYSGAAPVLRDLRFLRFLRISSRREIFTYLTPLTRYAACMASLELGRWSARNPRTFFTENTENTEFRGILYRTPENQDFHSAFLFRCRSCLTRPPYSPYSPYSPYQFAEPPCQFPRFR